MKMIIRYTLCLMGLILVQPVWAQMFSNTQEEEDLVSFRFRIYMHGRADFKNLYYFEEPGSPVPLSIRISQQSQEYRYRGSREFGIYRRFPSGEGEGGYHYQQVAGMEVSPDSGDLLIFLTPFQARGGSSREFSLAAMPALGQAIPANHVAFFNGTGADLAGVLGNHELRLGRGLSKNFPTSGLDTGDHVLLGLTVRYEDSLKVVLQTGVRFVPERRTLFVLLPPGKAGSFDIVAFRIIEGV